MLPREKKSAMSWALDLFVVISVLLVIGVLVFGLYLSKEGRSLGKSARTTKSHPLQSN